MPYLPTLATFKDILASIPSYINPFDYEQNLIDTVRFPKVPRGTNCVLIAFSAIHILTALVCIIILLRLIFSKSASQKAKYGWLFRRVYVEEKDGSPVETAALIFPNSGPLMACFQLLASLMAQAEIWSTFAVFKSYDLTPKYSLLLWLYISWLLAYYGYWVTTWASVYTRLYTQPAYVEAIKASRHYIFKPLYLNCFFIGLPFSVTVVQVGLLCWHIIAFCRERDIWAELVDSLKEAAKAWTTLNKSTNVATKILKDGLFKNVISDQNGIALIEKARKVTQMADSVKKIDIQLIRRSRVMAYTWGVFLLITLIVYTAATWSLISLIKAADDAAVRRKRKVQVGILGQRKNAYTAASREMDVEEKEARLLRRGLRYLSAHSLTMILAILYSTVVCFLMGSHAKAIVVREHWRGLVSWLSLASGIFIAIAMSFQFWRVWIDLEIIIPVQDPQRQHESDSGHDIPLQEKAQDLTLLSPCKSKN